MWKIRSRALIGQIRARTPHFLSVRNSFRGVHSAVDWQPWTEAAFTTAREHNKPLFVSSVSDSQWCELMANEAFANAGNAEILNSKFVPVQIHKDSERGIDKALMMFLQLRANGQGGWPLNAVLTPTRNEPFIAASFLSTEDLARFLTAGAEAWATKRELCEDVGAKATAELVGIRDSSHGHAGQLDAGDALEQAVLQYESLAAQSPRFVMGYALSVMARSSPAGRDLCAKVLHEMAPAGIVDPLNGGVYAYSISSDWHYPSFQKTLSGQATLLMACAAHLAPATKSPAVDDKVVEGLATRLVEYMRTLAPHTSQSCAASGPWKYSEFGAALTSLGLVERDIAQMHFGVNEAGNINPELDPLGHEVGQNVLSVHASDADVARAYGVPESKVRSVVEAALPLLQAYAHEHKPVLTNERVVSSDLGLVLSALAQAAAYVPQAKELAMQFAAQLEAVPSTDPAQTCDDYAYTVLGLLDFHKHVDSSPRWADAAHAWQQAQTQAFADANGGFFYAPNIPHLYFRPKYTWDGAEPNYNGVSAQNLHRLAKLGFNTADAAERALNVGIHGALSSPLAHLSYIA